MVMYDCVNDEMQKLLTEVGFKIGTGRSSEVTRLKSLDTACFNVEIGFQYEHFEDCWDDSRILESQLDQFAAFYDNNKTKMFKNKDVARKLEYEIVMEITDGLEKISRAV